MGQKASSAGGTWTWWRLARRTTQSCRSTSAAADDDGHRLSLGRPIRSTLSDDGRSSSSARGFLCSQRTCTKIGYVRPDGAAGGRVVSDSEACDMADKHTHHSSSNCTVYTLRAWGKVNTSLILQLIPIVYIMLYSNSQGLDLGWTRVSGRPPTGSRGRAPVGVWGRSPQKPDMHLYNLQWTNAFSKQ